MSAIISINGRSARSNYLFSVLRLKRDPFSRPAKAEVEIQEQPADPPFFRSFIDLDSQIQNQTYLDLLLSERDVALSGPPGSGKTTLRYNLAHKLRLQTLRTLAVTYEVDARSISSRRALPHGLTQALATDLFVQVAEQYSRLSREVDLNELTPALIEYWHAYIPSFYRNLQRHLRRSREDSEEAFLSGWWQIWKRPVVRYIPRTDSLLTFLQNLADEPPPRHRAPQNPALSQALKGIELAAQLGFQRLFMLVDEGDAAADSSAWLGVMSRLSRLASHPGLAMPIYLKLFLPDKMTATLSSTIASSLRSEPVFAMIQWNSPEAFRALLKRRFQSSGSRLAGFDVLASRDITSGLDEWLINSAQYSPRRFIEFANALIDAHAQRASQEPLISRADAETAARNCSGSPPALPKLDQGDVNERCHRGPQSPAL